jgi:hypothetical protein
MANAILLAFELLFGWWRRNLSRPFTLSGWTYEVCLSCGKKIAYDRADIASVVAQRRNLGRSESLQEGYDTISSVPAQGCATVCHEIPMNPNTANQGTLTIFSNRNRSKIVTRARNPYFGCDLSTGGSKPPTMLSHSASSRFSANRLGRPT